MQASRNLGQLVILTAIFVLFGAVFSGFVQPVLSGLLVAFILYPLLGRIFGKEPLPRRLGAIALTLLFTVFILLPLTFVGWVLIRDGLQMLEIARTGALSPDALLHVFDRLLTYSPVPREEIVEKGQLLVDGVATRILAYLTDFARSLPGFFLSLAIFLLTLFYGLADGTQLGDFLAGHLPFRPDLVERLLLRTQRIIRGAVLGTLLSAIAQGMILGIGFAALGVPRAFVVGLGTFFFSFIPLIGTAPTGIGGVIYLLAHDAPVRAILMGVIFLIGSTVDSVIKPMVLRGAADLHPLLALLSAIGGLALFGFIGIFVGPLVTALALEFLAIFHEERLAHQAANKD